MNISKRFFIFCATSAIFCALCAVPRIVYPADAAGVPTSEKTRLPALKVRELRINHIMRDDV